MTAVTKLFTESCSVLWTWVSPAASERWGVCSRAVWSVCQLDETKTAHLVLTLLCVIILIVICSTKYGYSQHLQCGTTNVNLIKYAFVIIIKSFFYTFCIYINTDKGKDFLMWDTLHCVNFIWLWYVNLVADLHFKHLDGWHSFSVSHFYTSVYLSLSLCL